MQPLPNSLELDLRLRALGALPVQYRPAFAKLEHFQERFRTEYFGLMGADQLDKDDLARTLSEATSTPQVEVAFVSIRELLTGERERLLDLYRLAKVGSIRQFLQTPQYWAFASAKADGRKMIDVIHGSIGTRRLIIALDNTFGNSFGSLFKHDIVAIWTAYFMAFVPHEKSGIADAGRIGRMEKLVDYLTKTKTVCKLRDTPFNWIQFTH